MYVKGNILVYFKNNEVRSESKNTNSIWGKLYFVSVEKSHQEVGHGVTLHL